MEQEFHGSGPDQDDADNSWMCTRKRRDEKALHFDVLNDFKKTRNQDLARVCYLGAKAFSIGAGMLW